MMIMSHIFCNDLKIGIISAFKYLMNDPGTFGSVLLHLFKLFGSKLTRFSEHLVIYSYFPKVMHGCRLYQILTERFT